MSAEGISEIAQQIIENHSTELVPLKDPLREAQLSIQQSTLSTALIKAVVIKFFGEMSTGWRIKNCTFEIFTFSLF